MLGLRNAELCSLDSPLTKAASHPYPVLQIFSELENGQDPRQNLYYLDVQLPTIALEIGDKKENLVLGRNIKSTDTGCHLGLVFDTLNKDTKEISDLVMLDGMEKGASVEVTQSSENVLLEESVDSSELRMEEDVQNISPNHDLTSLLHRIGVREMTEPAPQLSRNDLSKISEQIIHTNNIATDKNKDLPPLERDQTLHFTIKSIEESPDIHLQSSNDEAVADSENDLRLYVSESAQSLNSLDLSYMPCTGTQLPVNVCEVYEDCLNRDLTSDELTEYTNRHNPKNQISPHPSDHDKDDYECTMYCMQQKNVSEFKETHLKSILLKQVPCQTANSNKAFVQNHFPSTPANDDPESAQVNALVPYKNLFLEYANVPSEQCKTGSQDQALNREIILNEMKRTGLLNKKASFVAAGEKCRQIFEDVFALKAYDTSQRVVGNVNVNPENSIKNADCGQGLTMHPSIHLHLNECPVAGFDKPPNFVWKSSNIPLQIHFLDVLTTGKRIYLAGRSEHVAFSLDKSRLALSKHQDALSIPKESQLHNTSVGTVVCRTRSDRHCMEQSKRSSIHGGGALISVPLNKPLSANILNNEAISDCSFINLMPDCAIPQHGSDIKNHIYNKVAEAGSESNASSVSNCSGFLFSENTGEMCKVVASVQLMSAKIDSTTFGTEYSLQDHISPKLSVENELSVLPVPTIHHATRKRKGSTIISWIEGKRQYNCKRDVKNHQNLQELNFHPKKPSLLKRISKSKLKETNLNHCLGFDMEAAKGYTDIDIGTEYQSLVSSAPQKITKLITVQNVQSPQSTLSRQSRCSTVYDWLKQNEISQKHHTPLLKTACNVDVASAFSNSSFFAKSIFVEKQTKGNCTLPLAKANLTMTHRPSKHAAATLKSFSTSVTQDKYNPLFCNHMKQMLLPSKTKMGIKQRKLAPRGVVTPYRKPSIFHKCSKDQALLHQLSSIASRLISPHKSHRELKSLSHMIDGTHFVDVQLQARKLLRAFSCVSMRLTSTSKESSKAVIFTAARDRLISQHMNVHPASSHAGIFHSSDSRFSLDPSYPPTFPVSFHMKIDSKHLPDFLGFASPFPMIKRQASTTHLSQVSEWTLSLFLSSHTPASENVQLLTQWSPQFKALEPTNTDLSLGIPQLRSGDGCSMHGLYTVLALSSPGCYRLWTRRRNLGSRIPTVQRLTVAQFAQGLKGAWPFYSQGLFSCMPYSLGRILSTWSQHGPTNSSSYSVNHNANCCSWQKSLDIKYRNPELVSAVPLLFKTIPDLDTHSLKDNPDIAVLPKTSLHQKEPSPPFECSPPKAQVYPLEQQEALQNTCIQPNQKNQKQDLERKPQRVSQIRIRKTVPKPDPNLTPMGLPKAKRIKKKEFSLEDIYTNKNYKSPPPDRKLETIFEEPKERNGILECISHQKRKRVLEFRDCTVPRVKRPRVKVKVMVGYKRGRKAAIEGEQLDALLKKKLNELDHFIIEQEAMERKSEAAAIFCFGH
ncbi:uncharacterized protein prr14l.L [Xenopus laevis]|uniref:Uncharacterized protein prr14l.L n=2 Tax=Xenopus laevis TaxID=8355 RepID=A0A1L8I0X3_XENLA|nr:uncharacterized protein prr14l.L [Xenopus laevis]XP_018117243.1 uncharacterized protein prr14l.L [Xenopus laevis]XP_018117247.1 uncharacterized protein prr14l.L [Xenopus laevis]OCU01808.1 hypothetical protein XELAEV_18007586mg [Xenopus laevis]